MKMWFVAMTGYSLRLISIGVIVFIINLPFGYLRARAKKLSFKWFLWIHLPVPFVILLRLYFDVGFAYYTFLIFALCFFLGQFIGGKYIHRFYLRRRK